MFNMKTLPQHLLARAQAEPDRVAQRHKYRGIWRQYSFGDYAMTFLGYIGLASEDRVAVSVLAGIGLFFILARPALLPEDLRFLDRSTAQIEQALPGVLPEAIQRKVWAVFDSAGPKISELDALALIAVELAVMHAFVYTVGFAGGSRAATPASGFLYFTVVGYAVAALISTATGQTPYYLGKPNPLMMRSALNRLEAHSETTVMVGDRMDTDIISGLEAGMRTILVSTGSTRPDQVGRFPYRPTGVVDSIADLVPVVPGGDLPTS